MKNKILFSLIFLSTLFLLNSCEKKIDEAYANPNALVKAPVESLLPGIIGNFVGSASSAGSSYGTANDGLYVGRYIQFWATNTVGNQYDQMSGATGGSDVLGSVWAMHYYGMGQNLNRMIDWSIEDEKWDYAGVGYAIRAWSWLTLTEQYGEVIMTEAFNTSQLVFNYNTQEQVYDTVRTIARLALEYLNKTGGQTSQTNLALGDAYFYNGDVSKWKKFANAVIARSFHHLSNKSTYSPDSVIKYASLAMLTNGDNATSKFANSGIPGSANFYGPIRYSAAANVAALRQTTFIANLQNGLNPTFSGVADPRAWYLLRENTNKTIKGVRPNKGSDGLPIADQPLNFWGGTFATAVSPTNDANARYIFKNAAPFPIITASEIKFMLAEAYYRKGLKTDALNAYRDGISLNFDLLLSDYNSGVPADRQITPAIKAAYLSNPVVVPAAADLRLSHIMLQKYIALYGHGILETWTDMRRYHYTDVESGTTGQVYTDFTPPPVAEIYVNNNGKLPYRARPRYNSEYLYNVAELTRIGAIDLDYHTKEQWFTQK